MLARLTARDRGAAEGREVASERESGRARGAAPARVQPPFRGAEPGRDRSPTRFQPPLRAADSGRDRSPARPRSGLPPVLAGRLADLESERPRGAAEAGRELDRRGRGARDEVMGADSITAAPAPRHGECTEE